MSRVLTQPVERFNAAMPFHVRLPGENENFHRPLELLLRLACPSLLGHHRIRHQ